MLKCLMHNFDLYTDIMYVLTVPTYFYWIKICLIISIAAPYVLLIVGCIVLGGYKYRVVLMSCTSALFGAYPLYKVSLGDFEDMR